MKRKVSTMVATDSDFLGYIYMRNGCSAHNARQQMLDYIADYGNQDVTDLSFCILCQSSVTPSQKWTWFGEKYTWTEENGIPVDYKDSIHIRASWDYYTNGDCDPVEVLIRETRRQGIRAWLTFRMNDAHFHGEPTAFLRGSEFYKFYNPKQMVFGNTNGYFDTCFNFEDPQVRAHYLEYLKEQILRYDCDGVDLEFMRDIFCFEYWKKPADYYCRIMTEFLVDVKSILLEAEEKFGHRILLLVRLTRSVEQSRRFGFDAAQWIRRGLVDILAPSPRWGSTDSDIPVAQWVALTEGTPVQIFAGQELWLAVDQFGSSTYQTAETVKGYAAAAYDQGADGIYLSNYFTTDRIRHYDAWEGVSSPENAKKGTRRVVVTYQENDMVPMGETGYRPLPALFQYKHSIAVQTGKLKPSDKITIYCRLQQAKAAPQLLVNGIEAKPVKDTSAAFWQEGEGTLYAYRAEVLHGNSRQILEFLTTYEDPVTLSYLEIKVDSVE